MTLHFRPTLKCNMNCYGCSSPYNNTMNIKLEDIELINSFIIQYNQFINNFDNELDIEYVGGEILSEYTIDNILEFNKNFEKIFNIKNFGIQTNLIHKKKILKELETKLPNKYSTSYNFNNTRKFKSSSLLFKNQFKKNYNFIYENFNKKIPIIILITNKNVKQMFKMFKICNEQKINIIFRQFIPIGKGKNFNDLLLLNNEFSKQLIKIFEYKNKNIIVEPLNNMTEIVKNSYKEYCGYQSNCYKNSINIDPNGKAYTCLELAQLNYDIGDWKTGVLNKENILNLVKRSKILPEKCQKCEVVEYCKGGCIAEGLSYNNNIYKETFMCENYLYMFKYLKENLIY